MIGLRLVHGDRPIGTAEQGATGVENARASAPGADIDRANKLFRQDVLTLAPRPAIRSGNCSMSANIKSGSLDASRAFKAGLPACAPPVKAKTRMPAARAAATPAGLSSTTRHLRGWARMLAAACRNRSGAGFPLGHHAGAEQMRLHQPEQAGDVERIADAFQRAGRGDAERQAKLRQHLPDARRSASAPHGTLRIRSTRMAVRC
jgi:hypothetical protein